MSLLSPARAPSSAQGCPGDVIQPYTRHKGREAHPDGYTCPWLLGTAQKQNGRYFSYMEPDSHS